MNDLVKNSVESRKSAIFDNYSVTDQKVLDEINDYFERLETFAKDFNDVMEFETAFASSKLCTEYANIFSKILNSNTVQEPEPTVKDEIIDTVERRTRAKAKQGLYDAALRTPILGDAIDAKNKFDLINRFRKKS